MNNNLITECRASEYIKLDRPCKHLDLIAFNISASQFFQHPHLRYLISLDASRLGLDDKCIIELAQSQYISNLKWLDIKGNSAVGKEGVEAICASIRMGKLDLDWLDLRGSDYDATPYLDGGDDKTALWRMPLFAHELIKKYGLQKWMTLGSGKLEDENEEYIPIDQFPRSRF